VPQCSLKCDVWQVSLTKQSIRCDWTAWTWFVGLWVVMLVVGLIGLHAYWACRDKVPHQQTLNPNSRPKPYIQTLDPNPIPKPYTQTLDPNPIPKPYT
jgi:hypothetical protein